jgi:uncharacterized protein YdcH (DUF465 family)
MSNTPHELVDEFPGRSAEIAALKARDDRFARLTDEYHTLNREIHRAETNVAPTDDFHLEDLKKTRLSMLDEIVRRLQTP